MRDAILDYIIAKGWEHKILSSDHGDEVNLRVWPFCKDRKGHFYINLNTGQFICHRGDCGEKGSFYTLKKFLGDIIPLKSFDNLVISKVPEDNTIIVKSMEEAHANIWLDKDTLSYLVKTRKFSVDAIKHFKLGLSLEGEVRWLWYPYINNSCVKNVKMRSLPPAEKAFKRLKGGESCLFNEDSLLENSNTIIITEGESDCIALWSNHIHNVVGVTIGAQGIKSDWIDKLDKYANIYFAYDSDTAGETGAFKFANRLGIERCLRIKLPNSIKDVNQFFIDGHSVEEFSRLLEKAEKFDVESVKSLGQVIQQSLINIYNNNEEEAGIEFPWSSVTRLSGRMKGGDLWVVASKPKIGKSTFSFNIIYSLVGKGIPCLLFSLEMRPERMLPRIVALHLHKDSNEVNNFEDLSKAYNEMREYPFFFSCGYKKLDWQVISDTIRQSIKRYGIRFVVFDNLHFLCRSKEHMTQDISIMTQNFKLLAEELAIPILVIARPRKTGKGKMMEAEDLAWSADIEADADAVILLHREEKTMGGSTQEGVFEEETLVRINRIRYAAGGVIKLRCVDSQARFEEMI